MSNKLYFQAQLARPPGLVRKTRPRRHGVAPSGIFAPSLLYRILRSTLTIWGMINELHLRNPTTQFVQICRDAMVIVRLPFQTVRISLLTKCSQFQYPKLPMHSHAVTIASMQYNFSSASSQIRKLSNDAIGFVLAWK